MECSVVSVLRQLRHRLVEFLIHSSSQLGVPPIVKYTALSLFADRFFPSLPRFLRDNLTENWLLQPLQESNMQLFALVSILISSKIHSTRPLAVKSLKLLGDQIIMDQHFTVRDFVHAELVFMKVTLRQMKSFSFIVGNPAESFSDSRLELRMLPSSAWKSLLSNSAPAVILVEQLKVLMNMEVAKLGEIMKFDVCMDIMDLLYETEAMPMLCSSPHSLAASILVASYVITVPKQQYEFPLLPWVKFVTSYEEEEIGQLVGCILEHVLKPTRPVELPLRPPK